MDEHTRQPKIPLPEAIFIGLFIAFLDILDLIPIVGDFTTIIAAPLMLYLYMKGMNGVLFGTSEILDLIPGVQEFPCRSIAWWVTVGIDHFAPAKVAEVAEKAGELAEGAGEEGVGEAVGEEGGAAKGAREMGGSGRAEAEAEAPGHAGALQGEGGVSNNEGAGEARGVDGESDATGNEGGKDKEAERKMEMGSEISPEEEAEGQDFGSQEPRLDEAAEEEAPAPVPPSPAEKKRDYTEKSADRFRRALEAKENSSQDKHPERTEEREDEDDQAEAAA